MRANFFFLLLLGIQLFFFLLTFYVFVFLKTVSDNFKNYTPNNGGAVTMCKYAGVFIIGMRLLNYYAQTKGNFETKKIFSFVGAVVWGLCGKFQTLLSLCLPIHVLVFVKLIASFAGVITLATWEDANPPYSYVNLALQAAFTAGYIHQYSTMKDKNN